MTLEPSTTSSSPAADHVEVVGPDPSWAPLYRAGGVSAVLFVLLVLIPVVLVFAAPVPPVDGRDLLPFIAAHKVVYLIELVCFVGLSVPALVVFSATAVALKGVNKSMAALGGLFGVASEIIALALGSSPQSLHGGLVVLSNSYMTAHTNAERAGLVSAADALIAATNAVSWAGILTATGILVLSLVMWRGCFGPAVAAPRRARRRHRDRQRGAPPDDRPGVPGLRARCSRPGSPSWAGSSFDSARKAHPELLGEPVDHPWLVAW